MKFGWVGADALYGNNHEFLNALEDAGERFMADIHCNHKLWVERPVFRTTPPAPGQRGRPAKRLKLEPGHDLSHHRRVDEICRENFEEKSREISYRQGSKGLLTGRFYMAPVWVWDEKTAGPPREWMLIVREDESGDLKYSLTNFPPDTDPQRLASIQNQRYWIEHAFHEAKKELGMAQYQVRVWQGWNHHMALICLATVFMAKEKQRCSTSHPLLSCRDIVELLDHYLPRRHRDEDELHAQIQKRHAARQRDIDRRLQQKPGLKPRSNLIKQN